jgi:CheY-like chemotaxis protein
MLRTAAMLLELDGHRVTAAGSGGEALARLTGGSTRADYDVILTDLGMPGMNGLQLVAAVREAGIRTPCVLVTGWGMELSADDVEGTGAQAVLPKPFSANQLRAVLAEVAPTREVSAA